MKKDYTIGLDIGTNSVGWAVVDENLNLIRRRMKVLGNTDKKYIKKNFWGVRLFDSGETAKDTRLNRTTSRRLERRRNRILALQSIFKESIESVDPNFFHRLDESFIVPEDKKNDRHPIFGNLEEEVAYHKNYPTIYHLRKDLIDNDEKKDIRLVYLALAHIIKFRGHFLIEGELNVENSSIRGTFQDFIEEYSLTFDEEDIPSLSSEELDDIENIAQDNISRTEKFERIFSFFEGEKKNGLLAQLLRLIVGNKPNFKASFDLEEKFSLSFREETFEED